jgi:hypothetical protein
MWYIWNLTWMLLLGLWYLPVLIVFILISIIYLQDNVYEMETYACCDYGECVWKLAGCVGGCRALFTAPEGISWVHMAHLPNEPYGPFNVRCPGGYGVVHVVRWALGVLVVVGVVGIVVGLPSVAMGMNMYVHPPVYMHPLQCLTV